MCWPSRREALKKAGVDLPAVPPRYRSAYFSHAFAGGYSAGYYSYIWSEVLDADTVKWFKENGGLTRENGDRFRSTLLSRGGSEDPLQQFKNFTGGEPDVAPLLERRGLNNETTPPTAPQDIPPEKKRLTNVSRPSICRDRGSGMNTLIYIAIALVVLWVLARVFLAVTSVMLHLIWVIAVIFLVIWIVKKVAR